MGNKYSQISNDLFPQNYSILIFRQPDIIQAINAEMDLFDNLTEVLETNWKFGIKNEKKIRFGFELRLNNTPFSNESKPLEKLIQVNLLFCAILSNMLNNGYDVVSSGYIIKSFERSTLVFRRSNKNMITTTENLNICSIIFEGWNRIIVNNIDKSTEESLLKDIPTIFPINVVSIQCSNRFVSVELDGQPWDSHKPNSTKSPLLFLNIIRLLIRCNYKVISKAHITGYNDAVFLIKTADNVSRDNELFVLSLNQLDQLRTYSATSTTINNISKVIKSHWKKGIQSDSIQEKIWVCHLNGSPWSIANWDKDASFASKLLFMEILKTLSSDSWKMVLSIKLYRSQYDKSLFLFQRSSVSVEESFFFSIGPHDIDRLCLTLPPKGLINQLKDKFCEHWSKGIKEDIYDNGCMEYIMEGRPWFVSEESYIANLEAIGFFSWVLEHISESGWYMVETADICSTSAYSPTDYIFCKL